jgi:hypothetical protein
VAALKRLEGPERLVTGTMEPNEAAMTRLPERSPLHRRRPEERRQAVDHRSATIILLYNGEWYRKAIPAAEAAYEAYLKEQR